MNKKYILLFLIIIISIIFSGCTDTLKSYETNENSEYISDSKFNGGEKTDSIVKLQAISFHSWTGSQKIIFKFSSLKYIPEYKIKYDKNNKKLIITMENVVRDAASIEDYSGNKYIDEIEFVSNNDNFLEIQIKLKKKDIVYRIDEDSDNNNIIINIK